MSLTGDFGSLRDLIGRTGPARVAQLTTAAAQRMRATAMKLVADEFRHSVDPYGKPWQALAWRKGQPLRDTGRMAGAVIGTADGPTIQITIGTTYAVYHQKGAKVRKPAVSAKGKQRKSRGRVGNLPRRQMLPEESTGGLGFSWYRAFSKDADAVVRKAFTP